MLYLRRGRKRPLLEKRRAIMIRYQVKRASGCINPLAPLEGEVSTLDELLDAMRIWSFDPKDPQTLCSLIVDLNEDGLLEVVIYDDYIE